MSAGVWSFPRRGTPEWKQRRREVAHAIRYANSYTRMEAVLMAWPAMRHRAWLRILGREWSTCDNIAAYLPALRSLLANLPKSDLACMMTRDERDQWATLPKTFTAYRGCYLELNRDGICYSLERDVAAKFAGQYHRYRASGTPVLVTAKCRRSRAVLKLDRGEQEVIALHRRIVSVEPMTAVNERMEVAA